MSFAHLTLATRDVQATCRFYENTFDWKPLHAPSNSPLKVGWLEMGRGQQIHILEVKDFEVSPFEREFGRHWAVFHPGNTMTELKRRLTEQGAQLVDPIRPTPFERFFFKDPNGYVVEVINQEDYQIEE